MLAEARRHGTESATVMWTPGKHRPGPFYQRLGFEPTGEIDDDEIVARIQL